MEKFKKTGDGAAFEDLVNRHIDFVYSIALRNFDGNPQQAEDITQTVFCDLAAKAPSLPSNVILGGWLFRHCCFTAAKLRRTEARRINREREAAELAIQNQDKQATSDEILSILDEAINGLAEAERNVIVLRFLQQKTFAQVGETVGSSEDAARMRVARAMEKLKLFFVRRGLLLSASVLATVLNTQVSVAAPAGLSSTIACAAISKSVGAGGLGSGFAKLIGALKMKLAILGGFAIVAGGAIILKNDNVLIPSGSSPAVGLFRAQGTVAITTLNRDSSIRSVEQFVFGISYGKEMWRVDIVNHVKNDGPENMPSRPGLAFRNGAYRHFSTARSPDHNIYSTAYFSEWKTNLTDRAAADDVWPLEGFADSGDYPVDTLARVIWLAFASGQTFKTNNNSIAITPLWPGFTELKYRDKPFSALATISRTPPYFPLAISIVGPEKFAIGEYSVISWTNSFGLEIPREFQLKRFQYSKNSGVDKEKTSLVYAGVVTECSIPTSIDLPEAPSGLRVRDFRFNKGVQFFDYSVTNAFLPKTNPIVVARYRRVQRQWGLFPTETQSGLRKAVIITIMAFSIVTVIWIVVQKLQRN